MAAASNARCIQEVEQQEDRLSKLSDDILLSVLDRLDVQGAVRSGILSRRWRHLPLSISRITLDVKRHKLKDDGSRSALSKTAQANMSVAEAARSLLARRGQQQAVRVLYLRFYLRDESMDIVRAVDDAMARGCSIAKATFVILGEKIGVRCTVEDLASHATRFLSYLDACPRVFAGLTALVVESVKLEQSDINYVLGTCSGLKSLSLRNCDSGRDTALAVQLQHPRIVVLKLVTCGTIELKWLPELVKLTCEDWVPSRNPLLFGHVPRLRTVILMASCTSDYKILELSEILDNASIRELCMNFDAERLWIQPEGPKQLAPQLNNLRILNLDHIPEECGIAWTFFLLEAAPLLEELHIQVSNHQCEPMDEMLREHLFPKKTSVEWEPSSDFKQYNLATLAIYGFQPEKMFMGYITRIMEAAVNLEEISLYDEFCHSCGFCSSTRYPQTRTERNLIRKEINEGRSPPMDAILFYAPPKSVDEEPVEIID